MLSCQAGLDAKKQRKGTLLVKEVLEVNSEYTDLVYLSLKECTVKDIYRIIRLKENAVLES